MSTSKLVSVIIPTFNRRELLESAIQSVLNQTYSNLEVLVIDDCSNDDTSNYINSIEDTRVQYYRNRKTLFAPQCRNVGILKAKGEFIAFLDDDDIWLPNKLEHQIPLFEDNSVGLVYSSISLFYEDYNISYDTTPQKEGRIYKDMLIKNYIGGTVSVVIRKKSLEALNTEEMFDLNFPAREEYDLWIRLSKTCKVKYVSEPLVVAYYRNNISRISTNVNNYIQAIEILNNKYSEELQKMLTPDDQKERLYFQQFFLGSQAIKIGNSRLARKYFFKAIKLNISVKAITSYLISLLGAKAVIVSRIYFDKIKSTR